MNKKMLILVGLLLVGALLITGCSTTGSYDYSQRQQQAPIGGGCGVTAPLSEEASADLDANEPVF